MKIIMESNVARSFEPDKWVTTQVEEQTLEQFNEFKEWSESFYPNRIRFVADLKELQEKQDDQDFFSL